MVGQGDHLQSKMMKRVIKMTINDRRREKPDQREKVRGIQVNLVKYLQENHKKERRERRVNKEEIKASLVLVLLVHIIHHSYQAFKKEVQLDVVKKVKMLHLGVTTSSIVEELEEEALPEKVEKKMSTLTLYTMQSET